MAQGKRSIGTVKWFSGQKGFGFIILDDGGEDLFVHQTSIRSDGFRSLSEGETVEFEIDRGDDGQMKAVDVTGPNGSYVLGGGGGGGRRFSCRRGRGGGYGGYGRGGRGGGGRARMGGGYGGGGGRARMGGGYGVGAVGGYGVSGGGGGGYGVSGGGGYGGGGDGACYNCGQSGHMARDCYQGGGGGRSSNGGGGGGRGCYNCGEQGHFERECPYEQN